MATQDSSTTSQPGLRAGALRAGDVVVMALASSGPTQSVAVSLAAILATVAYAGFLPILICFIPMLGIALGYQRLHAWQPSAGATYSWVGRVLNPHMGFFAGWIMLLYYTVGTTSLTIPLGTYLLSFFSDDAANNSVAVAAVGTVFNLLVLAIAAIGVQLSSKFQWMWAIFEYALVIGFAIAAVIYIAGDHPGVVHIDSSWFTIEGAGGFKALVSGVLLAIFLYSGWDTAAYVGEESAGKRAGRAAVTSVVLLFVIYSVCILAFQGIAPMQEMQDHAANILAFVGEKIGGGFWAQVMIVAVLGGTLASLLAAIVSSSRIGYAMGRDRVIPAWFGKTSERYQTPWNATILFGLLNLVFLWGSTLIDSIGAALADVVSTLGLMAAIFYLLTATTAIWCYRHQITASATDFVVGGLLPGLGAAFMAFVVIYSVASGSLNGVELSFGVGLALVGVVLSFISARVGHAEFYTDPRRAFDTDGS
ncbi:APC family permease [Mycolicibacterium sp. CH28]|uniref:APC family permease n=1 Tax=Mycolicibacterium sp. CH28 TaxID=2512237 RepID=UPI0010811767|nr:APC family permease [Mycolicibacterium sp. CH28]TGD84853.1 APC family permease [Mycolicibacterium sp. CH28]